MYNISCSCPTLGESHNNYIMCYIIYKNINFIFEYWKALLKKFK